MSDFKSISDRTADSLPAPTRTSHLHEACQHWCFAYGCRRALCQTCDRNAANARMDAEYRARLAQRGIKP